MEDKNFVFVTGTLLFQTYNFDEYTPDPFDNTGKPAIRFSLKDCTIENQSQITPANKTKWFDDTSAEYVNTKTLYKLKVYDKDNKVLPSNAPMKGDKVQVAFKVVEKAIYPIAIQIIQSNTYNPFDR